MSISVKYVVDDFEVSSYFDNKKVAGFSVIPNLSIGNNQADWKSLIGFGLKGGTESKGMVI